MNKVGASNRFFYYTMHDKGTFSISYRVVLTQKVNPVILKEAANEALKCYPEFKCRPVIKNNLITYEENNESVVIIDSDQKVCEYGSDELNGYLFCFKCADYYFRLSFYHGLTDITGSMAYLKNVLYLYSKKLGLEMTPEEEEELLAQIRKSADEIADQMDAFDPYTKYGNADSKPEYIYDNRSSFSIQTPQYEEDCDYTHGSTITLKTDEFLQRTKEYKVSIVPLLVDLISSAIRKTYQVGDIPVTAMVPVDLRRFFDSKTLVNFSDGIMIPYEKEDEELSQNERCAKFKQLMLLQINRENAQRIIGNKVETLKGIESKPGSIYEVADSMCKVPPLDAKRPLTYAMTYPGKLDLPKALDQLVDSVVCEPVMRAYATSVNTYKNKLYIQVLHRNDDSTFAQCIYDEIKAAGFDARIEDHGHVYADKLILSKLKVAD